MRTLRITADGARRAGKGLRALVSGGRRARGLGSGRGAGVVRPADGSVSLATDAEQDGGSDRREGETGLEEPH